MPRTNATDRVALVTGGSKGIGREVMRQLAWRGARVTCVSRASGSGAAAVEAVREETGNDSVEFLPADLTSMTAVRRAVQRVRETHDRVDLLFNNAGAYFGSRTVTAEGHEASFALNHLSHFLLTVGLRECLVAAGEKHQPARVVTTSSGAARSARIRWDDLMLERKYSGRRAYSQSKLANQLFALELAHRWASEPVVSHVFHPGFVDTEIGPEGGVQAWLWRAAQRVAGRSKVEGADTALYLLCHPAVGTTSGRYWKDREPRRPAARARDADAQARLWQRSAELTGWSDP